MKNNKLQTQEKKYIKAVVEMYKFKNYDLDYERFGLLEVTRKINEDLELSDMGMYLIDEYVRELTQS